jgi:hypothetical protein
MGASCTTASSVVDFKSKLKVRTSEGASSDLAVDMMWTVTDLQKLIEEHVGVPKACQRLVFAGTSLKPSATLSSTGLVDGGDAVEQGQIWTMDRQPLEAFMGESPEACNENGLQVEFPLIGQFSPSHPVTLTSLEKSASNIPESAVEFAWSYPIVIGRNSASRTMLSRVSLVSVAMCIIIANIRSLMSQLFCHQRRRREVFN